MRPHLLDANLLIALTTVEHEHHLRASRWAAGQQRLATCPIVEGALTRFVIRLGGTHLVATELLRRVHGDPRFEFWPDSLSYTDVDLSPVVGHRQIADAYLVALAASRPGWQLATFDRALVRTWPDIAVHIS